jgi:hypothetical protein
MSRTLNEDITADTESTVLDELTGFAESVTYVPKNGPQRTVVMLVERPDENFSEGQPGLVSVERAFCLCLRDSNNATKGGVDKPQIGDGIMLPVASDPKQQLWAWTGEASEVLHGSWVLHFSRDVIFRQGGSEQTGSR